MKRYYLLIFALLAGILALVMITTSFCMNMSRTKELVVFKDKGGRVVAPIYAIDAMAARDGIPPDWPFYADVQGILDATNGVIGPLQGDPHKAGVLRYNLQSLLDELKPGATPVLFISPDGLTVKLMGTIAVGGNIRCDLTTLQFNNNKIWPRYLQTDYEYYLQIG